MLKKDIMIGRGRRGRVKAVRLFLMTAFRGLFWTKKKRNHTVLIWIANISRQTGKYKELWSRTGHRLVYLQSQSLQASFSLGVTTTVELRISFIQNHLDLITITAPKKRSGNLNDNNLQSLISSADKWKQEIENKRVHCSFLQDCWIWVSSGP